MVRLELLVDHAYELKKVTQNHRCTVNNDFDFFLLFFKFSICQREFLVINTGKRDFYH